MPKINLAIPKEYLNRKDPKFRYINQYNTKLTLPEMIEFHQWAQNQYKDPHIVYENLGDYDLQGAWKDIKNKQIDFDPATGHLTDKYKKPNHVTFSNQSIYHNEQTPGGEWLQTGENWNYKPSKHVLDTHGKENLQNYFKKYEPNVNLLFD